MSSEKEAPYRYTSTRS